MALFSRKPKAIKMQSLDELKPMIDSGRPVLLDFMQVNCGPCRVMDHQRTRRGIRGVGAHREG